jgi:thiol-disulfide isomerase/thioredoxin
MHPVGRQGEAECDQAERDDAEPRQAHPEAIVQARDSARDDVVRDERRARVEQPHEQQAERMAEGIGRARAQAVLVDRPGCPDARLRPEPGGEERAGHDERAEATAREQVVRLRPDEPAGDEADPEREADVERDAEQGGGHGPPGGRSAPGAPFALARHRVLLEVPLERRLLKAVLVIGMALGLAACRSGEVPRPDGAREQPGAAPTGAASSVTGSRTAAAAASAASPVATAARPSNAVEFPDAIRWHSWDDGVRLARAQNKPMMVVVYADWCPKCRALTPVFASAEVAELSKRLVVVRQNHDENPAWLQTYNEKYGGYVPRIFFFDPQGNVREDVTSGHPRYPYFYAAEQPDFLMRSMRQVIGS